MWYESSSYRTHSADSHRMSSIVSSTPLLHFSTVSVDAKKEERARRKRLTFVNDPVGLGRGTLNQQQPTVHRSPSQGVAGLRDVASHPAAAPRRNPARRAPPSGPPRRPWDADSSPLPHCATTPPGPTSTTPPPLLIQQFVPFDGDSASSVELHWRRSVCLQTTFSLSPNSVLYADGSFLEFGLL